MTQLRDRIMQSPRNEQIVRGCAEMIEHFFAGTGGVKGYALRSALSAGQRARPDLLVQSSRNLLPEFLDALDPYYQSWDPAEQSDFAQHLQAHQEPACDALLTVADRRAGNASNRMVVSLYGRMRSGARKDVARVLPELARLIAGELDTQRAEAS